MKVIILAAGRGSRLGERTKDRPKCMVEICGKTILERCISSLEEAGIHRDDIAIVTGYGKRSIGRSQRFDCMGRENHIGVAHQARLSP